MNQEERAELNELADEMAEALGVAYEKVYIDGGSVCLRPSDAQRVLESMKTIQDLGEALAELAHATLLIRTEKGKEGQIHVGMAAAGHPPRGVSEKSMVFIREALRPANNPLRETGAYGWPTDNTPNRGK